MKENAVSVDLRVSLGDALRRRRLDDGLTLQDVAGRTGSSVSYVSDVERGRRMPSLGWLVTWSEALGVSVAETLMGVWPFGPVAKPNVIRRPGDGRSRADSARE